MTERRWMYAQICSQPALLAATQALAAQRVREALRRCRPWRWRALYLVGCGDSWYAGLATALAFTRLGRLPVRALPALSFARYEAEALCQEAAVVGISYSGRVARTIEALGLARQAGAETLAVTGDATSPIAQEADAVIALAAPPLGRAPGLRSYTVQLLALLLCAIEVGERRQALPAAAAAAWRLRLRAVAATMQATLAANDARARRLASQLATAEDWVVLGAGPNYGTALFAAAKLVEGCGLNAWGQELEEWAHVQYFTRQPGIPTCLLMPPGRSLDRALELLPHVKGVGHPTLAVTGVPLPAVPMPADAVLPVPGTVPELLSPLVYRLPLELLAYYLAEARQATFFAADRTPISQGEDRLRQSRIVRRLEALAAIE